MEKWLSYDESDINNEIAQSPKEAQTLNTIHSDDKLLKQCNQSFEKAHQEMRHKATTDQIRIVFENLSILPLCCSGTSKYPSATPMIR
jgi:hypothetical protein